MIARFDTYLDLLNFQVMINDTLSRFVDS